MESQHNYLHKETNVKIVTNNETESLTEKK